ncbi:unnamed protein product [Schistosoma rodhaini]|uniref:ELMO domain-containing protein n=1 Tax=Schistosoma rodhaini TaxID=6188 RepID=A0AA85FDC3_9TREM|nr:unnamed protein product [Schistosoma rodhaini]
MSSQNFLKFGVEFEGNGQLFTFECPAVYDDIIYKVSQQFGIPQSETSNYCFRKTVHSGTIEYYTTEENCRIRTGDVVQLVEIPSRAVEKFISNLNKALDCLADNRNTTTITFVNSNCNPLHHLYGPFKQLLMELAIVLQCKQFNRDFVKCEGHCKLFHLVECIDKLDKKFHDEIWSYVLSCLLELSNHAITNRFIICNNTPNNNSSNSNNNNNNIKLYPHEICLTQENDPRKYLSEEMLIQQDENINQIQYSSTSILPMKNVYGVEEFFSWQLVSDKFLSVIIEHCRKETNLECLLNEMKLLLKIMTDYPVHIQYVTKQTEQGFVLDLLKIIQLNIVGYKSAVNYNSTRLETLRCEIQNLIMKFLYVIFYYGKQQSHLVCLIHQFYGNIQFTEWIPELRNRSLWELMINSYYRKKHHFDHSMMETFSSCLPSSDDNSENTVVLNFLKDFSNFLENEALCKTECIQSNNDNTNINIYNPSIDNVEKEPQQRILSHRLCSNNSITNTTIHGHNNKQSSMQLLISVCRVQQVINSLLFTIMKTPLARTSEETVEKMKQLCSAVYFDEYTINSTDQCIEEACIKLGFKIPTDPYADFEKPPGTLGFQCIYNYIMKNRNKLIDMLNYAYPCQKHSYLTTNTTNNHCKLNHLSEFNTLSSLNVNNNNDNNNVNEISSKSSQQRIQRHFSTVDSNSIKNILHTTHLHDDSIHNQRNNFTGRRFTMDSLIATSNLSQSFKPMKEYYSHNSFPCNYSISSSSTVSSSLIDKKPLFPIIEAANAVTSMLCELLATNDTIHEPIMIVEQDDKDFYLSSPLYPILLNKSNNNTNHYQSNLSSFEDIFDCVFSKFFSSWTQMKAVPEDLVAILCVVREQINRILKTIPISLEEFENSLIKFNPYDVPSMWSKRENRLRVDMLHNHPALIELRNDVRKRHQGHVYENRLNILSNSAPLEYIPSKGSKLCSKDNQSFTVLLSPDRKSLVIRDTNQIIREIWQLNCISRVSLGITEKVKKNPERTLLFQVELFDIPNQDDPNESTSNKPRCFRVTLLARSIIEYNYWLDGLFLLNKLNNPSDYYNEDVERLTELDMCIRLSSLDLNQLPKREISIPTDPPPPLDFI